MAKCMDDEMAEGEMPMKKKAMKKKMKAKKPVSYVSRVKRSVGK